MCIIYIYIFINNFLKILLEFLIPTFECIKIDSYKRFIIKFQYHLKFFFIFYYFLKKKYKMPKKKDCKKLKKNLFIKIIIQNIIIRTEKSNIRMF